MRIDRNWCKTFLLVSGILFVAGMLIYGFLVIQSPEDMWIDTLGRERIAHIALIALMGGVLLGGLMGGILMFARWVRWRSMTVKVLCAVFFFITLYGIVIVGVFGTLPIAIYCIVFLVRNKTDPLPLPGQGNLPNEAPYYQGWPPYPPGPHPQHWRNGAQFPNEKGSMPGCGVEQNMPPNENS